jgi:hypothetical protein
MTCDCHDKLDLVLAEMRFLREHISRGLTNTRNRIVARCSDCLLATNAGRCKHPLAPRDRRGMLTLAITKDDKPPPQECPLRDYGPLTFRMQYDESLQAAQEDERAAMKRGQDFYESLHAAKEDDGVAMKRARDSYRARTVSGLRGDQNE